MVVQVVEQLPILDQPLFEPRAISGAQLLQRGGALGLTHAPSVPGRSPEAETVIDCKRTRERVLSAPLGDGSLS